MRYKDYLQSDYWKQRRKEFRNKTHNRCYLCRVKNTELHVHHKRYWRGNRESVLFSEHHYDLRLLCKDCHFKLHRHKLEKKLTDGTKRRWLRDYMKTLP